MSWFSAFLSRPPRDLEKNWQRHNLDHVRVISDVTNLLIRSKWRWRSRSVDRSTHDRPAVGKIDQYVTKPAASIRFNSACDQHRMANPICRGVPIPTIKNPYA